MKPPKAPPHPFSPLQAGQPHHKLTSGVGALTVVAKWPLSLFPSHHGSYSKWGCQNFRGEWAEGS